MVKQGIVKTKDFQIFFNINYLSAYKKHLHLKDALGKTKNENKNGVVTVSEFCQYYQVDETYFYQIINHKNY